MAYGGDGPGYKAELRVLEINSIEIQTLFAYAGRYLCWMQPSKTFIRILDLDQLYDYNTSFDPLDHTRQLDLSCLLKPEKLVSIH